MLLFLNCWLRRALLGGTVLTGSLLAFAVVRDDVGGGVTYLVLLVLCLAGMRLMTHD